MPKRDYRSYNILENELANSEPYPKDNIHLIEPMQKEKIFDREKCYENENRDYTEEQIKENAKDYTEEQIEENAKEYTEEQIKENAKDYTEEQIKENAKEYTEEQIKENAKEYTEEQIKEYAKEYTEDHIKEYTEEYIGKSVKEHTKEKAEGDSIQQEVKATKRLNLHKRDREEKVQDRPFFEGRKQDSKKDNDIEKNLDFPAYKKYYQQKERSKIFKLIMALAKTICFIMLLPIIGIVGFGALIVLGSIVFIIVGSIGIGVFILGTVCFMLSQLSISLIALGITSSITLIAFGGIVLILVIMFIKWIIGLVRKNKRSQGKLMKEDR